MSTADRGRVEAIRVTDAAGAPMVAQHRVAAVAGVGLMGDRYADGAGRWSELPGTGREVTLIEAEEIERLAADHLGWHVNVAAVLPSGRHGRLCPGGMR